MADTTTSPSTLSSIVDELDRAILENLHGLGGQEESTENSSILELRQHLHDHLQAHGDCDMNTISLQCTFAPVPSWVPKSIAEAIGVTKTLTASEALAKAISKPRAAEITSLTSAVGRALSIRSASERSVHGSESARPSGLAAAERSGFSPHASGPSSTTTLLNTTTMHDHDHNQQVSRQLEAQRFNIGSTSRASGSTRAAARAELELELALAKEHRIQMQLQALEASSSRGGSDAGSLADRLSLVGLGSSSATRRAAPRVQGAARSSATQGVDAEAAVAITKAGNHHETTIPHDAQSTGHLRPESPLQLPILRPASLPQHEEPPTFGASIN